MLCVQKKYPLGVNKDVWVIHPTKSGGPLALGKTGYSFKTTKPKLQSSPWKSLNREPNMQLVEIMKVFVPGVKVMYPSKQPSKEVKTLDDVRDVDFAGEATLVAKWSFLTAKFSKKEASAIGF